MHQISSSSLQLAPYFNPFPRTHTHNNNQKKKKGKGKGTILVWNIIGHTVIPCPNSSIKIQTSIQSGTIKCCTSTMPFLISYNPTFVTLIVRSTKSNSTWCEMVLTLYSFWLHDGPMVCQASSWITYVTHSSHACQKIRFMRNWELPSSLSHVRH